MLKRNIEWAKGDLSDEGVFNFCSFRCKQLSNPNSFDTAIHNNRLKTGSKVHFILFEEEGFYFKVHFNPILRDG